MRHDGKMLRTVWGSLAGIGWLVLGGVVHAQHTEGCPIATADYGSEVERTFTDSKGRSAKVFIQLPAGHDPSVPTGILMYFHGNNLDPDNSYVAPLYEIQDRADAHGLIAVGLKSIGTRTNPDGTVVREWLNTDSRLLQELLLSDFGGCFKLDRSRVYLEGESQGTCFLSGALTVWLWRDFQGGVLGLCGCWGVGEYDYPVNIPTLRGRWKAFVENTTEDFLHDQGVIGFDIYKYNFGLDVRADLNRAGMHCADSRANAAAALDWMTNGTTYADPDANQPHWQMLDTRHNGLEDIAYDSTAGRFVFAVERADVTDDVIEKNEQVRASMFADNPQGFLDWRLANFPEYAVPPVLILTTSDYGATFTQVARRDSTGDENLRALTVAPDGSILVSAGLGVRKVNESSKTIDTFAFDGKLVYGLDRDESGNVFVHGAVVHVQRSHDSGASWTELTVPVKNQNAPWIVGYDAGYLTVIGDDGQVRYSQDGGDHFQAAPLPTGTLVDFGNHGQIFYAVMDDKTLRVSQNAGAAWQQATVPSGAVRGVEVLRGGDVVIALDAVAFTTGFTYRSKDAGKTWERERGAHDDTRMKFAFGKGDEAMMVTTRGIFRHSTGPLLDLGTPPAPIGKSAMDGGISGVGGGQGNGGSLSSTGGKGGVVVGMGTSGAGADAGASQGGSGAAAGGGGKSNAVYEGTPKTGCGCRLVPARPSIGPGALGLLALVLSARRFNRRRRGAPWL